MAQVHTDARSKPRTIIRMLSTKFTPRAVSVPAPPTVPNAYSKDQRDAALRARGLLPPLRPTRDLSAQEEEHDQHIPVLVPAPPATDPQPSAADLIKKEWVAKNHTVESSQRHRMNTFKFGGSSPIQESPPDQASSPIKPESSSKNRQLPPTPPTSPSPVDPTLLEEIQTNMFPSPPTSLPSLPPKRQLPTPPQSPPSPESPRLRLTDTPHSLNKDGGGGSGSGTNTPRPSPPTISITPSKALTKSGATIPTPTSPADGILSSAFHLRDDSFAQLEESVSSIMTPSLSTSSQTTDTSSYLSSAGGGSAKSKKLALGKTNGLQVKTREAATVPVIVESPVDQRFSQDLEVVEEEEAPSPAEMGVLEDGGRSKKKDKDRVDLVPLRIPMTAPATITISAPKSPTGAVSAAADPARRTRKRGMTDSTGTAGTVEGRRKLLNPFKRGQTVERPLPPSPTTKPDDNKPGDGGTQSSGNAKVDEKPEHTLRPRRLTMSASLSNLRRSFVGTLSRPSNSAAEGSATVGGKKFNAAHLPPSPTLPAAFAEASIVALMDSAGGGGGGRPRGGSGGSGSRQGRDGATPTPTARVARQPVVMYNRGSILLETANIEDEEMRRMTELAFLG